MNTLKALAACIALLAGVSCANVQEHATHTTTAHVVHKAAFVCTDTGLTGAAQEENLLYCDTNAITSVVTNAAPSTYQQSIQLAKTKHIIVGTPISVSETVDWSGTAITYVEFSSGFHAEHFNPSRGIARIYDQYDRQVYP